MNGQDNVQDALEAGGGGGPSTFPVGPLDDGTTTYSITADGGYLRASVQLDGSLTNENESRFELSSVVEGEGVATLGYSNATAQFTGIQISRGAA